MNKHNYRLAQKYLNLALLATKVARVVLELLGMISNYLSSGPLRHAST